MSKQIHICLLACIAFIYPCNGMQKNTIETTGLIVGGTIGYNVISDLKDKFSDTSNKNRITTYTNIIKKDNRTDFYINNANKMIDRSLKNNVFLYNFLSPLFNKTFIKKESKDTKIGNTGIKAIRKVIQPTIDNVKDTLGNTALAVGPFVGTALAFKFKKLSKNPREYIPKLLSRTAVWGIGAGLAINSMTDYIDNNPKQLIDLGLSFYGKHEDTILKELDAVCHNGLQHAKISLKNNNSFLHRLIKESPLKETQFITMDPQHTQQILAQYYHDVMDIIVSDFLLSPLHNGVRPLKINADFFSIDTDDSEQDNSDDDTKKNKKKNTREQEIQKLKNFNIL